MQCCPQIPETSPHKDCSYVLFGENHIQGSLVHSNRMEPKPKKEKAELSKINLTQKEKAKADLLEGLDLKIAIFPFTFLPLHFDSLLRKKPTKTKQKTQDRLLEKHRENQVPIQWTDASCMPEYKGKCFSFLPTFGFILGTSTHNRVTIICVSLCFSLVLFLFFPFLFI